MGAIVARKRQAGQPGWLDGSLNREGREERQEDWQFLGAPRAAADGTEYSARTILPDESGNPGPGEVALWRVVFEVPEGASGFTLLYSPPTLGGQEVQVDLCCSRPGPSPSPSP